MGQVYVTKASLINLKGINKDYKTVPSKETNANSSVSVHRFLVKGKFILLKILIKFASALSS